MVTTLPISRAMRACTAAARPAADRGSLAWRCRKTIVSRAQRKDGGNGLKLLKTYYDEPRDGLPQPEPLEVAVAEEADQECGRHRLRLGRDALLERLGRGRQLGQHVQHAVHHARTVGAVVQKVQQ